VPTNGTAENEAIRSRYFQAAREDEVANMTVPYSQIVAANENDFTAFAKNFSDTAKTAYQGTAAKRNFVTIKDSSGAVAEDLKKYGDFKVSGPPVDGKTTLTFWKHRSDTLTVNPVKVVTRTVKRLKKNVKDQATQRKTGLSGPSIKKKARFMIPIDIFYTVQEVEGFLPAAARENETLKIIWDAWNEKKTAWLEDWEKKNPGIKPENPFYGKFPDPEPPKNLPDSVKAKFWIFTKLKASTGSGLINALGEPANVELKYRPINSDEMLRGLEISWQIGCPGATALKGFEHSGVATAYLVKTNVKSPYTRNTVETMQLEPADEHDDESTEKYMVGDYMRKRGYGGVDPDQEPDYYEKDLAVGDEPAEIEAEQERGSAEKKEKKEKKKT
jgi:hypothetical protein